MTSENGSKVQLADEFIFAGIRPRVIFGFGAISATAAEVQRLGRSRALVVSTPNQERAAQALAQSLGTLAAGVHAHAREHTPVDVSEAAVALFKDLQADCVVALGGGSTIGLAKAIATRTGADQLVIPTTYAGSEMTDILGEVSEGQKTTTRDPSILPETVIYDVDLTMRMPKALTATSALNAMAHAIEALYAPDRNPLTSLVSIEAVRSFCEALPVLAEDPHNRPGRKAALYGAWLCGIALGGVSMSLHHKICHTLGGAFATPHAATHAIMLPHTTSFNNGAVPELLAPLHPFLGINPGVGLFDLAGGIGAPTRLADYGLSEADLDRAAELATQNPYANPRPITREAVRQMLQQAWRGTRPD